jgi:hypothetical protein
MPLGRDHFSGRVNLDDAEPVMREPVSTIPVGLRSMPGRGALVVFSFRRHRRSGA